MKTVVCLGMLFLGPIIFAQEVISSQGESFTNTSGSIDFTIGEAVIFTGTDGNNTITQGFHQTNWNLVEVIDYASNYEAIIYPNPSSEEIHVKTNDYDNTSYTLYDLNGKIVLENLLNQNISIIKVKQLAPGKYTLTLRRDKQLLKTFKLIKTP